MIDETGDMGISECNDMNIPVNCMFVEPDEPSLKWKWIADNFMPRKSSCGESMYEIEADTKEEILALIREYVVPLYEIAVNNLKETGENYFWEEPD